MKLLRGKDGLRLYSAPIVTTDNLVIRRRLYRNRKTVPVKLTTPQSTSIGWQFAAPVSVAGEPSRGDVPYVRTSPEFTTSVTVGVGIFGLCIAAGSGFNIAAFLGASCGFGWWLELQKDAAPIFEDEPIEFDTPTEDGIPIGKVYLQLTPNSTKVIDWPLDEPTTRRLWSKLQRNGGAWSRRELGDVLTQGQFADCNKQLVYHKLVSDNKVNDNGVKLFGVLL